MRERASGILCHPTSLPGRYGIGSLGRHARALLDFLVDAGQSYWQVLPLGPTGYGDSPYQAFSAFAGNPLLIDLDELVELELLSQDDLADAPVFAQGDVDYGAVIGHRDLVLRRASARLTAGQADAALQRELEAFSGQQAAWLDDYGLFMACKRRFDWAAWTDWEPGIALCQPDAVARWRDELADDVAHQRVLQWLFDRQWRALRGYAHAAGLRIIGDMPIFVGHDSADVWAHRDLYYLDEAGHPIVIAGVPPDYFSPTGQRWGNPLYRWDRMAERGYAWWIDRVSHALEQVDLLRLDHFRGFCGYWEIPADEPTAVNGRWVQGPGRAVFEALADALGGLPIIAEDLGLISADVHALRDELGLPGMRVLQFAYDSDASNDHLPHNCPANCILYTGTHDNDTTRGWYANAPAKTQHRFRSHTGSDGSSPAWTMIRLAMTSVADLAIVPLQDVLDLGSEGRLNLPGRAAGNWTWRYTEEALTPALAEALKALAVVSGRWWDEDEEPASGEPLILAYEPPLS
jgi:4-alpha-glucanotransferase